MHPKAKAPQEPTVKARTKALVEAFDILDKSEEEEDSEGEANNEHSIAIFRNLRLSIKMAIKTFFFQRRTSL